MISGKRFGINAKIHTTCYQRRRQQAQREKPGPAGMPPPPCSGSLDGLDAASASRAIRDLWSNPSGSNILTSK
jgi:hypothetical protein